MGSLDFGIIQSRHVVGGNPLGQQLRPNDVPCREYYTGSGFCLLPYRQASYPLSQYTIQALGFKMTKINVSNFLTCKHHEDFPLLVSANDPLRIFSVSHLSSIMARRCQSLNLCFYEIGIHPESPYRRSTEQFLPTPITCLIASFWMVVDFEVPNAFSIAHPRYYQ